jgi:inorganic pyrophosphatase/exopolyphosphatase
VIVHDADIGGIVDHHCLEEIVHVVNIGLKQSPLNSDGQQFNQ